MNSHNNTPSFASRITPGINEYPTMDTKQLRDAFLIENLFTADHINLFLTDLDRAITGAATPEKQILSLDTPDELRSEYFCERRELGIINIGGEGQIHIDNQSFTLDTHECLYVGRGVKQVLFQSTQPDTPAKFYFLSYPAHTSYPTQKATLTDAQPTEMGSDEQCNQRTIYKYIHPAGIKSCQLVMGFTQIHLGSCWNTMPTHTHERRTEIYLYFNMQPGQKVLHQMGKPQETRSLWISNQQATLSPSWSIHTGVGTAAYSFIWAMGGENQAFDDMDTIAIEDLR